MAKRGRSVIFFAGVVLLLCLTPVVEVSGANVKPVPNSLQNPASSTPAPMQQIPIIDIAIDDVWVDINADCRLWVRWKNVGNRKIDAVLRETIYVDGTSQSSDSMNQVVLEPNAVFAHGVGADPGLKLHGSRTVTATIDANNVLNAKGYRITNNTMVKTLTCGRARPDLVPSTVTCSTKQTYTDSQGHTCRVFQVGVRIMNISGVKAAGPFSVKLERDSGVNLAWQNFKTYSIPSLAAEGKLDIEPKAEADTCFWYLTNPKLSTVNPRVRVTVDSTNVVNESIETNNDTVHACNLY